ncbi:MAG: hypothetical protein QGD92_00565 [Gammaproteobacteria bacterium]|nr:hypothetical protein [Gammaproteobacteria bacterium]
MDIINIRYCFDLDSHRREVFRLRLDAHTLELINDPDNGFPEWTKLTFHQCSHCPLNVDVSPRCPVAINLLNVVERFERVNSYDQILLEVVTDERKVSQRTTAQQGISSLLGLLFASSGCPHTNFMKPMARFHLPLATEEETIYRATGMYLLAQYFLASAGKHANLELDGLREIYDNLHILNVSIADRVRSATDADSSANAVVLLDMLAHLVPIAIDDQLEEIRYLFGSYLSDYSGEKGNSD